MRGDNEQQAGMYSYISPEQRVPADHPLRPLRKMTDEIFKQLSPRFDQLYSRVGRPSIAPERLLRALLLQVLYSVRSERMLMEQLQYNLLFRWFVGLNMDDAVWDATTFTKNRDRLLRGEIAEEFFAAVLSLARSQELLSDEHFTVDGTLVEGWASLKSFQPKDKGRRGSGDDKPDDPGNPTVNFHGQKRSNETHQSTTDEDLRLFKKTKGSEAKLAYQGHVLMEHRNGLVVNATLTKASGTAEREAALALLGKRGRRRTLAADKAYDTKAFIAELRTVRVTPHVAQNDKRPGGSAIDQRTTRHSGYAVSQRKRKRVEEIFGWLKTVALLRKTRHRGQQLVGWMFKFATAAYNLVRIRNLTAVT